MAAPGDVGAGVSWRVRSDASRRGAMNWRDGLGNVLFQFNPRPAEKQIVMNSRRGSRWDGAEERIPLPVSSGVFEATISVRSDGFEVRDLDQPVCASVHECMSDISG